MDLFSPVDLLHVDSELAVLCSRPNTGATLDGLIDVGDIIQASIIVGDMT